MRLKSKKYKHRFIALECIGYKCTSTGRLPCTRHGSVHNIITMHARRQQQQ